MSSAKFTYDGLIDDLNGLVALDGGTWRVHLFTNNHTPTAADTFSDYTEPTFTGYAAQAIPGWNAAVLDTPSTVHVDATDFCSFQPSGSGSLPQTVYGAYFVDQNGFLMAAELFDNPFIFTDTGSILKYLARFFAVNSP